MTREQSCFLQLLRNYVHQRPSAMPPEDVDWIQVARYAEDLSLGGVLYVQCRDFLPRDSEALQCLHRGFYSAAYSYANGRAVMGQIGNAFQEAGIPYLPFKGEILRRYYPDPELRTMGDLDILVRRQDQEKADQVMQGLGYRRFVDNHAVWTYLKPNVMVEIHNMMFYEHLCNSVDYRTYFGHVWETAVPADGGTRYEPDPDVHFLLLVCHTAKHIINNGIGFRAFLDMVFMTRKENLDWDRIIAELDRLELLEFTKTCFAFCERWFDVTMPLAGGELEESFFEEITSKTFRDGTFGLHNEQNRAAHSAKEIRRSGKPYWITVLILTWKKLFPPYRDMQLVPWYSFVDGKPWLMPAAWIYRWFYTATHKSRHTRELLAEPIAKRDTINRRKELLNNWKL